MPDIWASKSLVPTTCNHVRCLFCILSSCPHLKPCMFLWHACMHCFHFMFLWKVFNAIFWFLARVRAYFVPLCIWMCWFCISILQELALNPSLLIVHVMYCCHVRCHAKLHEKANAFQLMYLTPFSRPCFDVMFCRCVLKPLLHHVLRTYFDVSFEHQCLTPHLDVMFWCHAVWSFDVILSRRFLRHIDVISNVLRHVLLSLRYRWPHRSLPELHRTYGWTTVWQENILPSKIHNNTNFLNLFASVQTSIVK